MLKDHGETIYPDLLRFFGVDIHDLFREEKHLTPKQVLLLIRSLPPESATSASIRKLPEAAGWGMDTYLLASLIDAVRENSHINAQAHSKKKLKRPERIKVPGMVKSSKGGINPIEVAYSKHLEAKNG